MAEFLLVHGSCHGAWCWRAVVPLLRAAGHRATAIDLPSHGADVTPVADVSLDLYAKSIAAHCGAETVIVGHSMAGYAITAAALLVPEKIAKLVYLCAYVPRQDMTHAQMRMEAPDQPLLDAVVAAADGRSFTVDRAKAPALFYNDCSDQDIAYALPRLCQQAVAPSQEVVQFSAKAAAIPRHYIRCLNDKTIPPEFQMTMTEGWPASDVQDMQTGHSPFFSDPHGLVTCLLRAAKGVPDGQ